MPHSQRPIGPQPGLLGSLLLRCLVAGTAPALAAAASQAEEPAPALAAETPQQKASLEALDRALARFEALLARDDDAPHQAAARSVLGGLKQRRDGLRAAFDQSRCDDLRAELNLAYQRQAAWMAPARVPPPPAGKPGP